MARQRTSYLGDLALVALVFVASSLFKLATFAVTNDDYLHLASAQQILLGEMPLRDFIDQREWLLTYTSAAVQAVAGRSLLSEVLLDIVFLSAGHALVYLLSATASRSRLLGLCAAGFSVLLAPRLYSYPKVFLYAAALTLIWHYARRPRTSNLLGVALFTVVAFLFRHDHGAVIGSAMVAMLVLVHWQRGWPDVSRVVLTYAVSIVTLLIPFFGFLQWHGGIGAYVTSSYLMAQAEYQRTVGPAPDLQLDWIGFVPMPHEVPRRIKVRWAQPLEPEARAAAEARLGLSSPEDNGQNTWTYDLMDASRPHVLTLVRDPLVEDTDGINRTTGAVPATRDDPNAGAWLFYLTLALPPLAFCVLGLDLFRRGVADRVKDPEWQRMVTAAVLAALMQLFLLRTKSDVAVADVGASTAVLAAWLVSRGLRWGTSAAGVPRNHRLWVGVRVVVTMWLVVATGVACVRTSGGIQLSRLIRRQTEPVRSRVADLNRARAPYGDAVARYVFACTNESDRLLAAAEYMPDIYYRSGRGFAAGLGSFVGSLVPTAASQAFTLTRLQAQHVPIAITTDDEEVRFADAHPGLHAYLLQHYRVAGEIGDFTVMVDDRVRPLRTYAPGDLPCFR